MLANELMTDDIPPLKTSDTGVRALAWMDELRVSHLPIVNNVDFLGLISENDILDLNAPNDPIGNHTLSLCVLTYTATSIFMRFYACYRNTSFR